MIYLVHVTQIFQETRFFFIFFSYCLLLFFFSRHILVVILTRKLTLTSFFKLRSHSAHLHSVILSLWHIFYITCCVLVFFSASWNSILLESKNQILFVSMPPVLYWIKSIKLTILCNKQTPWIICLVYILNVYISPWFLRPTIIWPNSLL